MMDNGKSLIQRAAGLEKSPEAIVATNLADIFNRSQSARFGLTRVVEQHSGYITPIASVETQEEGGYPLDLVGFDAQGAARVILVPVFEAKLPYLGGGLNHCFNRLADDGPSAVLFVAPEERIWDRGKAMWWRELELRARQAGKKLPDDSWKTLSSTVDDSQRRLMLVSWPDLLNVIEYQTGADLSVKSTVQELRAFTEFMGVSKRLINGATRQGIDEGWAVTRWADHGRQELIAVRQPYGFGRYVRLVDMPQELWFGINWHLWAKSPDTLPLGVDPVGGQQSILCDRLLPLEVYPPVDGRYFTPVHLNPAASYAENLPEVVRQLRAIARAFQVATPRV